MNLNLNMNLVNSTLENSDSDTKSLIGYGM